MSQLIILSLTDKLNETVWYQGENAKKVNRAPETRNIIRSLPTVMNYADAIHKHYFPDYEHWDDDKEGEKQM